MKNAVSLPNRLVVIHVVTGILICAGSSAFAGSVARQRETQPGGMPGLPRMTGVQRLTNGVSISWDGPAGRYQLFQKTATDPHWKALGAPTSEQAVTISEVHSNAFFKVEGPAPHYAGSRACEECHQQTSQLEMGTKHPKALEALKQIGQDKNPSCLPCHTVGFGLPSGFVSEEATPHLAGVQCENCHGPAREHAAYSDDPIVKPPVDLAAEVCGGCHTGPQQPTFEEWKSSAHAVVTEDMNPTNRINSCGRCHSGSARLSLLKNKPLPVGDANVPIVCVVCHDPHQQTGNPAQLRNPVASMEDYFLSTSDDFTNKYNPNINICAQCHNHRGASWSSSNRPPHHSPQYNILLGTVGELAEGQTPAGAAAHAGIERQCVGCHMQSKPFTSEEAPAITGHTFKVSSFETCRQCHPEPEALVEFTADAITNQIQEIKAALDLWGTTKSPEPLRSKYGALAWEYTVAGELSSGSGPTSTEQALIPVNIQKARFNLYLVLYDGSYGAHNGPHSITLLDAARSWVEEELAK
jgi:hypothetical protein